MKVEKTGRASGNTATVDGKRRFLFEELDLRGEIVHLEGALGEVAAVHDYPTGVHRLLGEFLAAAVLLASNLKFKGSLTVQARSEAQIPLLMAECSSELTVRAIARGADAASGADFAALLGGGLLTLTVTPARGKRYQGIVPLAASSLAASIDAYFEQSEQLQTRLYLACDGSRAAGLLLQQLPPARVRDSAQREEHWQRVCMLTDTLQDDELLALGEAELLHRLFHEEEVRLFDLESVRFRCSCSQDRTLAALATLGEAEIRDILSEQGAITMDCEFCNQRYVFREEDLRGLLGQPDPRSLH
ncbi:MAG: Hsp33 family molecular chaperone HslO [Halieaceae bacterium]|jgi:molecular chaperone Hsp33|nr:Hsp33 family molecular chaperone HslO [Halieaceae bacterium]